MWTSQTKSVPQVGLSTHLDKSLLREYIVMIAHPHTSSAIHTHADQDTIVYCLRGKGAVLSEGGKKKQVLAPGDFALIPSKAEHQEVNEGDEEVEWIITRSGRTPVVENLEGWGKPEG